MATMGRPDPFSKATAARADTATAQIQSVGTGLDSYRLDHGRYPTTAQGLLALWQKPTIDPPASWSEPYLRKPVPEDPWGRPYVYVAPGTVNPTRYDLLTYGADGLPGGTGENADITSWK